MLSLLLISLKDYVRKKFSKVESNLKTINVWIPKQKEFSLFREDCKNLYEKVKDKITDTNSFEFICDNTFFYMFESDGKLIGAIYYFINDDGNLYLNGFANRKMHDLCLKCLKMSLTWFKGRVYAVAQNRASALCLLKCGFKRENDNLFVFCKNL